MNFTTSNRDVSLCIRTRKLEEPGPGCPFGFDGLPRLTLPETMDRFYFHDGLFLRHSSKFRCGLGATATESLPFLHLIAAGVTDAVTTKGGTAESAMPSIAVAYLLSTLMTGAVFYLVGAFQLGQVIDTDFHHRDKVVVDALECLRLCNRVVANSLPLLVWKRMRTYSIEIDECCVT